MARNCIPNECGTVATRSRFVLLLVFKSLYDLLEGYVESFHQLQHLTVDDVELNAIDLFSAFQNTLSSLSLYQVSFTLDVFIQLLGYFPNLRELHLGKPTFCADHRSTPPPSTPPRGTLALSTLSAKNADILVRGLSELGLEYDELDIYKVNGNPTCIYSLISSCGKTLKYLKLCPRTLHTFHNHITDPA
jgi:hypothetical protein